MTVSFGGFAPVPQPRMISADEAEEFDSLRELRAKVEAMEAAAQHVFSHPGGGQPFGKCLRIEVPVREWDEVADAIGDLERIDLDRKDRS